MAPGGRISRQTTLTGETIRSSHSPNESATTPITTAGAKSTAIKKGRGKTRGKGLEKLKRSLGVKMPIEIPLGKGRPTDIVQSAKLSNELGIIARNFIPVPNKWKELSREDKDAALIRCNERFEIKLDENYVKDSCEEILKNRVRQWRHNLKKKLEKAEEEGRQIEVPEELTPENWNKLRDMWSSPAHKKRCEINKINRAKLQYNHYMGSKAFVAARAEIGEPDRIEFYKKTHHSEDKGWSNSEAETTYLKMQDLKKLYFDSEKPSMTIDEIVDYVLGTKSGYVKGLGYGPKPDTIRVTQRKAAVLQDSLRRAKEEGAIIQNDLQERLKEAEALVASQQTQIQGLNSQLTNVLACQQEILKEMKHLKGSSPSSDQANMSSS